MKKDLIAKELEIEEIQLQKIEIMENKEENENDYEFVRRNMREAIQSAKDSLDELKIETSASRNSKDYRVLHEFLTSYINANEKLLQISNTKNIPPSEPPKQVTQNLFVGTTKEVLELIKQNKK